MDNSAHLTEPLESGLTAEDHAYGHAAEAYFAEKSPRAHDNLDPQQLAVFVSFEEHWRGFFAPVDPDRRREYLTIPFQLRKAQFERFKRECRSWEVTFRHSTKTAREPRSSASGSHWNDIQRRKDEQNSKAEEVREFYVHMDQVLDKERRRRSHPMELVTHLRILGVPYDAPLDAIKRQYKRLAKLHHPDRQGDAAKMSRIADAYRAITNYYRIAG